MSFDFDAAVVAPFRMQPGLRRLAAGAGQLSANAPDSRHLREKLDVLRRDPGQALLCAEGFDPWPALQALAAQSAREHPAAWTWDGRTATARWLGWSVAGEQVRPLASAAGPLAEVGDCLANLPGPWRLAGLLSLAFAEDFAIIDGRTAHIPWLAVALPSHWVPAQKVGRHFAEVHAPVADNQLLLAASDALARLVSNPTRWERFVWTLTPQATLCAHPALALKPAWPAGDDEATAAAAWWRTERQTFIPLPDLAQAVFTIHVEVSPLKVAIAGAGRARRLHDALASMSAAVLDYRGLTEVREPLLRWLAARAAG